jgi:hypothetical protein
MNLSRPLATAILTLTVAAGCDNLDRATAPAPEDGALAARAVQPQSMLTSDDVYAQVARSEVPGFAGFFLRDDGTPVIRLVDQRQRGAAERFVAQEIAAARQSGRLTGAPQRPVFADARYDFAQLKDWSDQLHTLFIRDDVYLMDVDEVENRVFVGVRDETAIAAVRAHAARIGVPGDALHVETQPAPEQRSTLRHHHSTLRGGLQIAFSGGLCTLGFNAWWNGAWSFVTNSHCTPGYFSFDGGTIYQPSFTSGNDIGWEVADRGLYACISGSSSCRRADAAYIRHNGKRGVARGQIARTDWNTGGPGGLTITGTYDITARYSGSVPVGMWLDKTGRTSGTTYGQVTHSCVSIGNLRCQDVSKVWSEGGDSGSPMYVWQGGNQVHLYGILWGGPGSDWTTTYSSRLSGIELDLGALAGVCVSSAGC